MAPQGIQHILSVPKESRLDGKPKKRIGCALRAVTENDACAEIIVVRAGETNGARSAPLLAFLYPRDFREMPCPGVPSR